MPVAVRKTPLAGTTLILHLALAMNFKLKPEAPLAKIAAAPSSSTTGSPPGPQSKAAPLAIAQAASEMDLPLAVGGDKKRLISGASELSVTGMSAQLCCLTVTFFLSFFRSGCCNGNSELLFEVPLSADIYSESHGGGSESDELEASTDGIVLFRAGLAGVTDFQEALTFFFTGASGGLGPLPDWSKPPSAEEQAFVAEGLAELAKLQAQEQ